MPKGYRTLSEEQKQEIIGRIKEKGDVTVRDRDTMKQERTKIEESAEYFEGRLS